MATGEADVALGGDQAGSVRIPAALCGVVRLKPTFGLVPCTGTLAFHHCVDHVGPLTRTVAENAQVLSVIAGPDGSDSRQFHSYDRHTDDNELGHYTKEIEDGIRGFRIGLLKEGFELPHSDSQVLSLVERVLETALPQLGATLTMVSIPEHVGLARHIATGMYEGDVVCAILQNFTHFGHSDPGIPGLAEHFGRALREQSNAALPPLWRKLLLFSECVAERRARGDLYTKAQRLRPTLRRAYDRVFSGGADGVDALVMPTVTCTAHAHPLSIPNQSTEVEQIPTASEMTQETPVSLECTRLRREWRAIDLNGRDWNTVPFNLTGHPALTLPCGWIAECEGEFPVGLQLVVPHWQERNLYRIAQKIEDYLNST